MIMALLHVNFFARTLGMGMSMDVILPEGDQGIGVNGIPQWNDGRSDQLLWDGSSALPTLYLLHGTSDDSTIWQRRTAIERYVSDKKLAVVMPNVHLSAYCDQKFGYKYFTFLSQEVPEFCQRYFHCSAKPEENFIAGLSMGGYGALKIGLRCPDRFGYAAGLSAGCNRLRGVEEALGDTPSPEALLARKDQMDPQGYQRALQFLLNFGSAEEYRTSKETNLFNIASEIAEQEKPYPHLFITCGWDDPGVQANRDFHAHLEALGIDHLYYEAAGAHTWEYWDTHIQKVLEWLPI